jgi:hypothetical protein
LQNLGFDQATKGGPWRAKAMTVAKADEKMGTQYARPPMKED